MIYNVPYFVVVILILLGFYVLLFKRNMLKMVFGIIFIGSGVNLFLITLGYRGGGVFPIVSDSTVTVTSFPVVQVVVISCILVIVAIIALMLSFVQSLYRHYGSLDVDSLGGLKK